MSNLFKSNGKDLKIEKDGKWLDTPFAGPENLRYHNIKKIKYNPDTGIMYFVEGETDETS